MNATSTNMVDWIKDQLLSNGQIGQLSSLIGAGEGATKSAVAAAVPALLSALSSAASGDGAQKLANAVGRFDPESVSAMLVQQPSVVAEQGTGLLNSLLGGGIVSGIVNAISRHAGMGSGAVQKLLGYLMPLILGGIASRFAGRIASPQGLASMFAEQKANIANAIPRGFSLSDVPGLATAGSAIRTTASGTQDAGAAALRWLWPVLGLAALALVAWLIYRSMGTPTVTAPNVTQVTGDLTGISRTLTDTLGGIKDAAAAETALPKITELSTKLDGLKTVVDKLPEAGRAKVTDLLKSSFGKIEEQVGRLQWIPGVGEKVKSAVDGVMGKLASLGGLPVPQTAQVSGDLADTIAMLTKELGGVKDSVSAEAALPKLKEINSKLDDAKVVMGNLSDSGKSTISSLLRAALDKLQDVVKTVLATPGVGDIVKPMVESIMGKLTALAA